MMQQELLNRGAILFQFARSFPGRRRSFTQYGVVSAFVLITAFFCQGIAGQPPENPRQSPEQVRPYEGLLQQSDLRLRELRNKLKEGAQVPEFLSLRYRGTEGNYAVFYDLDGIEARYRYRSDPFDDLGDRKLRDLRPGQAYRVRGTFSGIMDEGLVHTPDSERYGALVASSRGQIVFEFLSAENIQPDFLFH